MMQNLSSFRQRFTVQRLIPIGMIAIGLLSLQFPGCSNAPALGVDQTNSPSAQEVQAAPTPEVTSAQETGGAAAEAPEAQDGVLKKAGDLLDRAKSTTGSTAQGAREWVQDKIGGAADASSAATEDTIKWATDTFESLKSKGLTTANDTSQWLSQDWKNIESWEYQIIAMDGKSDEEKTNELNELGKNGWECYHVSNSGPTERFYVKKRRESYLRHLPFKDFIKLVPLLQQANQ